MVCGIATSLGPPLLLLNFVLYMTGVCLAAWAQNRNIDSQIQIAENNIGDAVTTWFLPLALISCMVGLASVAAGVRHKLLGRSESLAVAAAASLIAWVLDLVSLGFAVKEVEISGGNRPGNLKVIEAFIIIVAIFELCNCLMLNETCGITDAVNNNFFHQGPVFRQQPGLCNRPSIYNQVATPHMHHHHPHGSMMQQRPSSPR